ncbi:uncharacterized protein LOC111612542 [Centruroides sculpturatus]|uniref:uncharacterized protein LOC111612542 n=1 Tax=Centruroides sculpturatus TaxID=218467 RepID=UPI000C6DEE63|nr:uncharacterized protein LOC111612542 [Centruroides sculpturatus]
MDVRNTIEYSTCEKDDSAEDSFKNIVNAILRLTSDINADFPEETEMSSSNSDEEEEGDFWFLETTSCENRPLKKEFLFLEKHSLVKKIIYEENEDDDVSIKLDEGEVTNRL